MPHRRQFIKSVAGAAAATLASGYTGRTTFAQTAAGRRQVTIGGKRIKVIDVHTHCAIPLGDLLKGTPLEKRAPATTGPLVVGPERLRVMDQHGIDIQVLTQQGSWWYEAKDRDLASAIVKTQNEKTAELCRRYPDRFVAMASVALQFPDLAAQQLEDGVKRLGMRGGAIAAGSVQGKELSSRDLDPFWAKAQELGVLLFMHPGGNTGEGDARFEGQGSLTNTIGNPLDTTFLLSHLIFEGTFDRFPGLKICGAHAGGYLPSYMGRTEAACARNPGECNAKKPIESYFRNQILADTMIFRPEGLRHLVAEMGVSQIVYGTDIPYPWPVNVDFILDAPFLTNADKEAILGGNLTRLLRLTS